MVNGMILITGGSGFIGTNLQELFIDLGYSFVNFDKNEPTKKDHLQYWFKGDIMNLSDLSIVFSKYSPSVVIHLAAVTDTASDNLDDYKENTIGTKNVIDEILKHPNLERCIITSTQYVYKSLKKPFPSSDEEYVPHTTYGISKKETEEIVRNSPLECCWTIVRPTNVWGPWHMRYPEQLWKFMDKGWYIHPTKRSVIRTYAYVKNLTHQLNGILNAKPDIVNKQTFYLGDLPVDSNIWLSEWILQLKGQKLRYVFPFVMRSAAIIGDILRKMGIKFPMYSVRYKNMLEDYYAPTNVTIRLFGLYNNDLTSNVKETIGWLHRDAKLYFDYWKFRSK